MAGLGGHRKGAGRPKGVPNKITREMRPIMQAIVERNLKDAQQILDDIRYGTVIEKTMPDGSIVSGRLNAKPEEMMKILLNLAEFCIPKLGRTEHVGGDGPPIVFRIEED